MSKRSATRRSEDGDAVRVLAPELNSRRARSVETTSSTPSASPAATLLVAAIIGVLGFAAFLVFIGDESADETPPLGTLPPLEIAASEPVVPGRTIDVTSPWEGGDGIAGAEIVADTAVGGRGLAAAGMSDSRAAVWVSSTGSSWEAASIETPPGSSSQVEEIAYGNGGWMGIGTVDGESAVWRAEDWDFWELLETRADLDDVDTVVDLTVGPGGRFWLIGNAADGSMLWTSPDGFRWTKRDPGFEPAEIVVNAAAAEEDAGGWLYLAGSRCRDAVCRPALWKTQDGITWIGAETASGFPGGELSDDSGAVATVSVAANRIVAAGSADVGSFSVPAVWISSDGVTWAASGEATLGSSAVNIRLQRVSDTEPWVASLTVAGRAADVTAGDTLVTEIGLVAVANVHRSRVALRFGGEDIDLGIGSYVALRVNRAITSVAAQADRIVAVGFESDRGGANQAPAAWISVDGGSSWEMHRLPDRGVLPAFVGLHRRRVIAVSAGGESWYRDWDANAAAAAATEAVARLFAAVADGNLAEVIATLPETRSDLRGELEYPGLADVGADWWDESSEFLDPFALAGTLAFVTELDTAVRVFDCTGTPVWSLGYVRVNCDFAITSGFLRAMGVTEDRGTLSALVAEGAVVSLTRSGNESAWQELEAWVRKTDPRTASLVFGAEDGGTPPQIDAALASGYLAWAERYRDAFLLPGDSIDVATPVGSMTWSVIDPFGGQMVDRVGFARGAFWALAADIDSFGWGGDQMLWWSESGMEWEVVGELPTGDRWWPIAGADRILVARSGGEALTLAEWNGAGWIELEIAVLEPGSWGLQSMAESNGRVLILGEGWDERGNGPLGGALWTQAPDDGFEVVAVDGPDFTTEASRSLIGTESGFVLIISDVDGDPSETGVWGSPDGVTWELLTDQPGFGDGWIRWVGTVDGDLVVIALGGEDCSGTDEPCRTVWQQWRSANGIDWELAGEVTGDRALAWGPLGLVAIGQDGSYGAPRPISVLMTDRAGQFAELADVGVRVPGADWVWPGDAAMSDSAIVVPINAGYEGVGEMDEDSWLLVGRLLGP